MLGQAELLVIDEAAAIPLPLVRKLMGPYLVFMASTINGYEGTGRSLSLKLIQQLREQARGASKVNGDETDVADRSTGKAAKSSDTGYTGGRSTLPKSKMNTQGCPHPSQCQLLYVNRDTLFSFHPVSEKFLQQMMALYVASHYKNSPNDLQLMSDAPAHQLFVLVPPIDEEATRLPEPLCVIQVALEGRISRQSVLSGLSRGQRAGGDLIPWLVSQQFQDSEFAGLSGSRVVRIGDMALVRFSSSRISMRGNLRRCQKRKTRKVKKSFVSPMKNSRLRIYLTIPSMSAIFEQCLRYFPNSLNGDRTVSVTAGSLTA